jgi:hypothetical protein
MTLPWSSAPAASRADFVARHGLQRLHHYVDEGGAWTEAEFGVHLSPVALVLKADRLESAYLFNDIAAVRARIDQDWQRQQKEAAV